MRNDVTAETDGTYSFAGNERLHPGTWDVWAVAAGCAVIHRRLELAADTTADFALAPGGRIVVRAIGSGVIGLEPAVHDAAGTVLVRPRFPWEKQRLAQLAIAPLEADGSAEIDGCRQHQTLLRVALPMARRGIIVGGILIWTRSFGIFGPLMIFVGAVRMRTEVLPTTIYLEQSVGRIEVALAVAILMLALATAALVAVRLIGLGKT